MIDRQPKYARVLGIGETQRETYFVPSKTLCHVSPETITDYLEPGEDGYLYFSIGEFMSYYGDTLYLFDLEKLRQKYDVFEKGETYHAKLEARPNGDKLEYREKRSFTEFVSRERIPVSEAIAILKHRDLSKDNFLGKRKNAN